MSDQRTANHSKHRTAKIVVAVLGHLGATTTLFVAIIAFFTSDLSYILMRDGIADAGQRPEILSSLVLLYGVAACFWALSFIAYTVFRQRLHDERVTKLKKVKHHTDSSDE